MQFVLNLVWLCIGKVSTYSQAEMFTENLCVTFFNMDEIAVACNVLLFTGSLATRRCFDDRGFSHLNQMGENKQPRINWA